MKVVLMTREEYEAKAVEEGFILKPDGLADERVPNVVWPVHDSEIDGEFWPNFDATLKLARECRRRRGLA